jgi:hypothetical protein
MGGHHQSDQDFRLGDHGHRQENRPILRRSLATVQLCCWPCHSS